MTLNNIPPASQGFDVQQNSIGQFVFTHGSAIYCFVFQGGFGGDFGEGSNGDQKLHAMKSTDGGGTWVEQDASNALVFGGTGGFGGSYTIGVDGNTVYVLYLDVGTVFGGPVINSFNIVPYDLTSDTWGGSPTNYTTPAIEFWVPSGQAIAGYQIITRAAGDMLFYFNGAFESVSSTNYGRVYYATFDGTTFGSPVMLAGQSGNAVGYTPVSAVYESTSGITTFTFADVTDGGFDQDLYSVGLNNSNTMGSRQLIVTGVYGVGTGNQATSDVIAYDVSGTKYLGIVSWIDIPPDSFTAQDIIFYSAPVTLNPTWSATTITSANDDTTSSFGGSTTSIATNCPCPAFNATGFFGRVMTLVVVGSTLYAIWAVEQAIPNGLSDTTSSYYSSSATAAATPSWSAAAKLYSSPYQGFGGAAQGDINTGVVQVFALDIGGVLGVLGLECDSDEHEYAGFFTLAQGGLKNYTSGKQGAVGGLVTGVLGNYTF